VSEAAKGEVVPLPQAPEAIELRHLRSFVAVAEELNFTRASERLFLSRPALSRQISLLERLVGVQLLRRTTHSVELTVAGDALLVRARRLLDDVDAAVQATQSIGGELVGRMARIWDPVAVRLGADVGIESTRRAFESFHAHFAPPEDVGVRPVNAGGVPGLVIEPGVGAPTTALHLHGGVHVMGSAFGFRHLGGALAAALGVGVLMADYRLAPEHPHPAAIEDAVAAFGWLLEQGIASADTILTGDSTGCLLALGALMVMRDRELPLPGQVALLCPSIDLRWPYEDPITEQMRPQLARWTEMYLDGHPIDDPVLNPITADLSGLPPVLVQACTGDTWLGHARRLVENAQAHDVEASLELYPTDVHGFQYFWSFLPEAADAIERIALFHRRLYGGAV
jgi:epsilon-lactone hydrolase